MATRKSDNPHQPKRGRESDARGAPKVSVAIGSPGSSSVTNLKALARLLARQGAREWVAGASSRMETGLIAASRNSRVPISDEEGER